MEEQTDSDYNPEYNEVSTATRDRVQIGDSFNVEFVHVNHSIPDCAALIIRTPLGVVVHSGDWRFEDNPVEDQKFDMERLTEVASKEGILCLLNESTNAESEGTHIHSERDIQVSFGEVMDKYPASRLIFSCFSSHTYRMQLILEEAKKHGRKVAFAGYSMIQNLEVALTIRYIKSSQRRCCQNGRYCKTPRRQSNYYMYWFTGRI